LQADTLVFTWDMIGVLALVSKFV